MIYSFKAIQVYCRIELQCKKDCKIRQIRSAQCPKGYSMLFSHTIKKVTGLCMCVRVNKRSEGLREKEMEGSIVFLSCKSRPLSVCQNELSEKLLFSSFNCSNRRGKIFSFSLS